MKEKILRSYRQDPERFLFKIGILKLKMNGYQASCRCPLHSDQNPSFSINLESGQWKCHAGCGSGDIFTLYKNINSFSGSFYELLKEMTSLC